MTELRTERLVLRRWKDSDLEPWAAMNADPEVRRHLGEVLTREQSEASVARFEEEFEVRGYGWFAVEIHATGTFIGFAGLDDVEDELPLTGVEIGWRLARAAWGHGYASEAARAVLAFGFDRLKLDQIVAVTTATNHRSQAVMQRIGMTRDPAEDFLDPTVPEGPLQPNVVYRINAGASSPAEARQGIEEAHTEHGVDIEQWRTPGRPACATTSRGPAAGMSWSSSADWGEHRDWLEEISAPAQPE